MIQYIINFLLILNAGLATLSLTSLFSWSPVISSACIGLFGALIFKIFNHNKYSVYFYCGSFIGMSSLSVLDNFWYVFFASFISCLVSIVFKEKFHGYGGKLGMMAFLGVFTVYFLKLSFQGLI